jgi:DNA-binding NarL/FixJ family response regulator
LALLEKGSARRAYLLRRVCAIVVHACLTARLDRTTIVSRKRMPIRIAIGDDSLIVREGLRRMLDEDRDLEIVATVADLPALKAVCDRERPDVVVTDIRMPPTNTTEGITLATDLRETHPEIGVVVLSQFADPVYALALLDQGSDRRGYLLKDRLRDRAELTAAIHAVHEGRSMIDPRVVEELVYAQTRARVSPLADLTPRERQVLAEIAQGKSNAAIAESLVLTKRAVEKHINTVFAKLGLDDSRDASKRVKATLMLLSEDAGSAREPA